ncbi:MFS transporter [Actinomadura sp. SCN-SB]|uniref:MFS transporter n=1 Tax=Actinomadura sp. SCN-SB TaxID=3373092 RepID=UPI0037509673
MPAMPVAPAARRPFIPRPWLVLGLLTAFWGLVGLNRLGISYLFPVIIPEFGMTYTQASLLISGTSLAWAFSSWLAGWLSDRHGRRAVLIPGAALACVSTAAMGGTWNFWSMFVVREFVGLGDGVGWPNAQAVLAAEFPAKRRALVQSIFTAGYPLFGSVLGAVIITRMADAFGWRPVWPIIGGVFLLVVLGLYVVMREPALPAGKEERPGLLEALKVVRNRRVVALMIVQSGALGWLQVSVAFNAVFLTDARGLSLVDAGSVLAVFGLATLTGTLVLPTVSDYIGRRTMLVAAGLASGAFLTFYVLGGFGVVMSAALLAASGFFQGVLIPLGSATCVVEQVPARIQATAMGAVNFAGVIIGTTLLPIIGGQLGDRLGLTAPMLLAAGAVVVAGLAAMSVQETAPRLVARRKAAMPEGAADGLKA